MTTGLFVYGTLRLPWHPMIPETVVRRPARTRGRLWYRRDDGPTYPVLTVGDDHQRVVVGDLLVDVRPSDLPDVVEMERGAGYVLSIIRLDDGDDAYAFVWPHLDHGSEIDPDADVVDWLQETER